MITPSIRVGNAREGATVGNSVIGLAASANNFKRADAWPGNMIRLFETLKETERRYID